MDAYLDTNIISGLVNVDLGEEQRPAELLLDLHENGHVRLWTSLVAKEEIGRISFAAYREPKHAMYERLLRLPELDEHLPFHGTLLMRAVAAKGKVRFVVRHSTLKRLQRIVPDRDDARHLFHAIRHGVPHFVTMDERTTLCHDEALYEAFGITVLPPSRLLDAVQSQVS